MAWDVEYTDEFESWWNGLGNDAQIAIDASVRLLERFGPMLPFPHSSAVRGSRHGSMRELRVQRRGRPLRVLYAFDPRRTAITNEPKAGILFDAHLEDLQRAGGSDG